MSFPIIDTISHEIKAHPRLRLEDNENEQLDEQRSESTGRKRRHPKHRPKRSRRDEYGLDYIQRKLKKKKRKHSTRKKDDRNTGNYRDVDNQLEEVIDECML